MIQFENENSLRKYPLDQDATCLDDGGTPLPTGILGGISIVTCFEPTNVRLSSVYVGSGIKSISISDDSGLLATATVEQGFSGQSMLDPARDGVAGVVDFLDYSTAVAESHRFSTPGQSLIHRFCVTVVDLPCVSRFVDDTSGEEASGDTAIEILSNNVEASSRDTDAGSGVEVRVGDSFAKTMSSECSPTSFSNVCIAPIILSINGTKPNADGEIAIVLQ